MANVRCSAKRAKFEIVLKDAGRKALYTHNVRKAEEGDDEPDYPEVGARVQMSFWDIVHIFGVRSQDKENKFFEDDIELVSQY